MEILFQPMPLASLMRTRCAKYALMPVQKISSVASAYIPVSSTEELVFACSRIVPVWKLKLTLETEIGSCALTIADVTIPKLPRCVSIRDQI